MFGKSLMVERRGGEKLHLAVDQNATKTACGLKLDLPAHMLQAHVPTVLSIADHTHTCQRCLPGSAEASRKLIEDGLAHKEANNR